MNKTKIIISIIVLAVLIFTVKKGMDIGESNKEYIFLVEKAVYYKKNIEQYPDTVNCPEFGVRINQMNSNYDITVGKMKLQKFSELKTFYRLTFRDDLIKDDSFSEISHPCIN